MIKKYFIIALRTFRRNKLFSLINVLGLSVGISAALVIYLIAQYDFSFEKFQKDGSRIYRIVTTMKFSGETYPNSGVPYPLAAAARNEVSGVEESAWFFTGGIGKTSIPKTGGAPLVFKGQPGIVYADDHYFRIFPFYQWIAGSPASLDQPYQTVISESRAKIYFPGLTDARIIGKTVIYDDSLSCKVAGIVKDLRENTDLLFKDFVSLPTMKHSSSKDQVNTEWGSVTSASQLFVRLTPNTAPLAIERQLAALRQKHSEDKKDSTNTTTHALQPLTDIHFSGPYDNFDQRQANKPTLYALLLVALFLLALGSINFINLTTAQAAKRTKEIGIRKTMGSSGRQLILQFLSEAFLLTLVSGLLSLALTPWLLKVFADFIPPGLSFDLLHRLDILLVLAGLILVVSFLSGFYPALILSRLSPALVLKNQAYTGTATTRKAMLRKTLTVFQFIIAQVFIMGTIIVSKQVRYALNEDMGFNKDAIVFFRTPYEAAQPEIKQTLLKDKLATLPGISLISLGGGPPAEQGTWSRGMTYNDGKKEIGTDVQIKNTDTNYLRLYGLKLLAGRIAVKSDSPQQLVINQTYAHILGFNDPQQALGKMLSKGRNTIVGVMADFHQTSIHKPIKALALIAGGNDRYYVHIGLQRQAAGTSTWTATLAQVARAFKEVYPGEEFEYHFVDDSIAKFYTEEQHIARLLAWATGLTIFISCLGLLGLVIYSTQLRIKEIGIRKVLGASILQIVSILSKDFVKLVGIAFLIAVPIALFGTWKWLENFAYRTTINWWIFPLSGGSMILIALLIMGLKTIRAANANPVNSLRSE